MKSKGMPLTSPIKDHFSRLNNIAVLYIGCTVLFTVAALFFLVAQLHEKEESYLKDATQQQKFQLRALLYSMEHVADAIFQNGIDKEEILSVFAEAHDAPVEEQGRIRELLYEKLTPAYAKMREQGVRQLHFHLPTNISFLRFHRPDKFGDSLQGVRHSIDLVNRTHQPVKGFEEGRVFPGFRNVYPLNYQGKFIGTVEVSFSFLALRNLAVDLFPGIYTLILNQDIIAEAVWQDEQFSYAPCLISNAHVKYKDILLHIREELPKLNIVSFETLQQININLIAKVEKRLEAQEEFSISYRLPKENKLLLLTFLPLKNIAGKQVAYFISFRGDTYLYSYFKRFKRMSTLIVAAGIFLLLVGYLFLHQAVKRRKYMNLATTDSLTGLANRLHFDLVADRMLKEAKRKNGVFSLAILDIDDFKPVNDTFGHDAGDKVLRDVALLLQRCLREQDFVARWGGEEFVVLLPETYGEDACVACEKMRLSIEEAVIQTKDSTVKITCSFGVSEFTPPLTAHDLVKKADIALYRAKESGKNCVVRN